MKKYVVQIGKQVILVQIRTKRVVRKGPLQLVGPFSVTTFLPMNNYWWWIGHGTSMHPSPATLTKTRVGSESGHAVTVRVTKNYDSHLNWRNTWFRLENKIEKQVILVQTKTKRVVRKGPLQWLCPFSVTTFLPMNNYWWWIGHGTSMHPFPATLTKTRVGSESGHAVTVRVTIASTARVPLLCCARTWTWK